MKAIIINCDGIHHKLSHLFDKTKTLRHIISIVSAILTNQSQPEDFIFQWTTSHEVAKSTNVMVYALFIFYFTQCTSKERPLLPRLLTKILTLQYNHEAARNTDCPETH